MPFLPSRKAVEILGVHPNTLRSWANKGFIDAKRTPGGQRLYNVESFIGTTKTTQSFCYCRVSSSKQRKDLERQVEYMRDRFPSHYIIRDIGGGLNFKRKGLLTLLEFVCRGRVKEIVVAHKDRLARFGYDLIRWLVERHGGQLVVLNHVEVSPEEELVRDVLAILHCFSCRLYGRRKYRQTREKDSVVSDRGTTSSAPAVDGHSTVCL